MRLVSRWARHSVREEGRRCRSSRTVRGCSTNARRCPWRQRAKVSRRHIVRLKSGCDSLHVSRSPCQRRPLRDDRRDRLRMRMPDPGLGAAAFFQLKMRRQLHSSSPSQAIASVRCMDLAALCACGNGAVKTERRPMPNGRPAGTSHADGAERHATRRAKRRATRESTAAPRGRRYVTRHPRRQFVFSPRWEVT